MREWMQRRARRWAERCRNSVEWASVRMDEEGQEEGVGEIGLESIGTKDYRWLERLYLYVNQRIKAISQSGSVPWKFPPTRQRPSWNGLGLRSVYACIMLTYKYYNFDFGPLEEELQEDPDSGSHHNIVYHSVITCEVATIAAHNLNLHRMNYALPASFHYAEIDWINIVCIPTFQLMIQILSINLEQWINADMNLCLCLYLPYIFIVQKSRVKMWLPKIPTTCLSKESLISAQ